MGDCGSEQGYTLVRPKRDWVPEWAWWIAAHVDRRARWATRWLTRELTRAELVGDVNPSVGDD